MILSHAKFPSYSQLHKQQINEILKRKGGGGGLYKITMQEFSLRRRLLVDIRQIKIHVYRKRQTSDSSWEFLRIENREIKTVPNDSSG